MGNFQSITKETIIPPHVIGEFIWKGGMNIKQTTRELYLDNISLSEDYETRSPKMDKNGWRIVEVSGYPTNVYQAMANVRYRYYGILEWDVLLARWFKVEKWEIIVDLPNGLKGVVSNVREIANNQMRTARINTTWNDFFYTQKGLEIPVLDVVMLQDGVTKINESSDQKRDAEPSDFAKKLMEAAWQTVEKKSETKRNDYLKVEVLPQIKERTIIDKEQIPHFIWSKWKNIKFLQDKFNVILKTNDRKVEIIGSEACVIEAKKEIERMYKDTVVEAEIVSRSWWLIEVKLPNWDKKNIHTWGEKFKNGTKVKVIIFDKEGYWEKIELLEVTDKNPVRETPRIIEDKSKLDSSRNKNNKPRNWISEIEAEVFCRINTTNVVLKMPEGFNQRISINPDSKLNDGDKVRVKVKIHTVSGAYEIIELIEELR